MFWSGKISAQIKDSTIVVTPKTDSVTADTTSKKHKKMSKYDKAALMSAILPGLGQIGHHDTWWHVPIIYAGFATLGYFIQDNNTQYVRYVGYFHQRLKTDADTSDHNYDPYNQLNPKRIGTLSDDGLLNDYVLYYRRNRDLLIIVTSVWYLANIVDAYVAAQLRDFDITNNLSMRFSPLNIALVGNQPFVTCGLKFNLK